MTLEERIEAAREAYAIFGQVGALRAFKPNADVVAAMLAASVPELFATPPTAWLAPMEASLEISEALRRLRDVEDIWRGIGNVYFASQKPDSPTSGKDVAR